MFAGMQFSQSRVLKGLMGALVLAAGLPGWASVATTTTLAVTSDGRSVTTVTRESVVTLTATVKAGTALVTAGQVNFCDAAAKHCIDIHLEGTAHLTKAGTATYKFRPGVGTHSYKAVFVGTTKDATSTSATEGLTVTGNGAAPTVDAIAQSGKPGNYTLTAKVGGTGGYAPTGTVSFLDETRSDAVLRTATLGTGTPGLRFLGSATMKVGTLPFSIAAGDFNGDGITDLAVTNAVSNSVTILLGKGDGTFTETATSPATGNYPSSVVVGDFNGDGIQDLAVTNDDASTVTILLGKGDGTFTAVASTPATGSYPTGIAVGDFNGDGIQDLAVANSGGSTLTVLLGKGDGTFTPASSNPETGAGPRSVAVGDFNGDGIQDLAVANENSDSVTILLGKGDGTFKAAAASPATGLYPHFVAVCDFNRDGFQDLAIANYGGNSITVLLGKGDGTFTPTATSPVTGKGPWGEAIGDFNGDGVPDIAVVNQNSESVTVMLGRGDGTFVTTNTPATGGMPNELVAADLNGDGIPDLAVVNDQSDSVTVLLTETKTEAATATGIAVLPLATGTHEVIASYSGDSNYLESTSMPTPLVAAKGTPILGLIVTTATPVRYGLPINFVATVKGSGLTPTGAVTFRDGTTILDTVTLNGSGAAGFTATMLGAGSHSITAVYSGDSNYVSVPTEAVLILNIEKAQLTVIASNVSVAYNLSIPSLTYSVTGFVNGDSSSVLSGAPTETTTAKKGSLPGNYPIAIAQGTLSAANYSFVFKNGTLTITPLGTVATPVFTPKAGTYVTAQSVTLSDVTPGATIYYTINGTTPTLSSTKYASVAIKVSATTTIKAIAVATGYTASAVASATYTITPPAPTPTFTPAAGTYTSAQTVKIADKATTGLVIYYTTNGTAPTTGSTKYTTAGIVVSATETIKAIAVASGYSASSVASATYTIQSGGGKPATTVYVIQNPAVFGSGSGEVLEFSAAASGSVSPKNTITAPSGNNFQGLATDSAGNVYVSTNAPSAQSLLEYAAAATGSATPIRSIPGNNTTMMYSPDGIAIAANGDIVVAQDEGGVATYSSTANGTVAPKYYILGYSQTGGGLSDLIEAQSVAIGSAGELYIYNDGAFVGSPLEVFSATATGNVAPIRTLGRGGAVATDSAGNLYIAQSNTIGTNSILEYSPTANGSATPIRTISGAATLIGTLGGIKVDGAGNIYVISTTSQGKNPVLLKFAATASGNVAPVSSFTSSAWTNPDWVGSLAVY